MLVTWKQPLSSGGSKIKEYYVDKRRSGGTTWREVHVPPVSGRVYKVHKSFCLTSHFWWKCSETVQKRTSSSPIPHSVWQVEGLTAGAVYQFQVYAANLAGLGPASKPSEDFTCEGWTMPEPGERLVSS